MKQHCEWCEKEAQYRYRTSKRMDYERYSCRDPEHKKKVSYLMDMDLGSKDLRRVEVCVSGFEVKE